MAPEDGAARAARVGLRLRPEGDDAAALRALVATAALAERAGFDLVAVPERVAGPGGAPAALPVCAAIAASTSRIRIATALVPLPLHHPLRLAEDAATVDVVSGGRFELGVGLGLDASELASFGLDEGERASRFEESVALLRLAWRGGAFDFDGRHFRFAPLEVSPRPLQPGGPPLWVGATAEAAQRRAARLGAGLVTPAASACDAYLAACAAAGTTPRVALLAERGSAARARLDALAGAGVARDLWLDRLAGDTLDALVACQEEARAASARA